MLFESYQQRAKQFAVFPESGTGSVNELLYLSLGLAGESGEVCEKIKKYYRDGIIDKQQVKKELGDVLWYLSMLALALGFSMNEIAIENLGKLTRRSENGTLRGSGDNR